MKFNTLSYCSVVAFVNFFVLLMSNNTTYASVEPDNFFDEVGAEVVGFFSSKSSREDVKIFTFPDYSPETDICTVDYDKLRNEENEVSVDLTLALNTEGTGLMTLAFQDGVFAGLSTRGWCVDLERKIGKGNYQFDVFSSLDTSGAIHEDAVDKPERLSALNWLMNEIPTGTIVTIPGCKTDHMITDQEYQLATWLIIDNATRDAVFNGWKKNKQILEEHCVVDWLYEQAIDNQNSYEPNCYNSNGKIGLLLVVDDDEDNNKILNQVIMAEIDVRHACACLPISSSPSMSPVKAPTENPTKVPTKYSSGGAKTAPPTPTPTHSESAAPSPKETGRETAAPTPETAAPTGPDPETMAPTPKETSPQTLNPTSQPTTPTPTRIPSKYNPGDSKSMSPTVNPTKVPTDTPPTKGPAGPQTLDPTSTPTGPDPETMAPTPKETGPQTPNPSSQTTTSAPTRAPSKSPSAEPTKNQGANGDPHFKTWSGERYDFHGICDLILLSNPKFYDNLGMDIYIRSKKTKQWSYISTAVIRIGVETFEVSGREDGDTHWFNGIKGDDNGNGILWEEETNIAGYPITYRRVHSTQREYTISLGDDNEKIVFKTWKDFVRVDIVNPRDEDFTGSLGLMGSYPDGNSIGRFTLSSSIKDMNLFGQEWQVLATDPKLFHSVEGPQSPSRCELPSKSSLRRRLSKSEISREDAEVLCSIISEKEERDLCAFDVMATGDKSTVNAY